MKKMKMLSKKIQKEIILRKDFFDLGLLLMNVIGVHSVNISLLITILSSSAQEKRSKEEK